MRGTGSSGGRGRRRWLAGGGWRWWLAVGAGAVLAAAVAAIVAAMSWQQALAAEQRLLPGTTIAGVDVGGRSVVEARAVAARAAAAALERSVAVSVGDVEAQVSAGQLEATTDAADVVAAAVEATASASLGTVSRSRWLPGGKVFDADVTVTVPDDTVAAFVADLAEEFDLDARDATVEWAGQGLAVREAEPGRRIDRGAAVATLRAALEGGETPLALPHEVLTPAVSTAMVEEVLPAVDDAVAAALDRVVTVAHDGQRWQVSARDLAATPDARPALDAALTARAASQPGVRGADPPAGAAVPLTVPYRRLGAFLDDVAAGVDVDAEDARIDYASGWVELVPEEPGRALDRDTAARLLRDGLSGAGSDVIDAPVVPVEAETTTEDYRHVLLVRQDQRRLYLYVDGHSTRDWAVAIGAGGSQTPTGEFEIGAKRHLPTWYNPAPNGWGANMPRVVGPGPTNPLGVRALNWNRDGSDTLIRFHGTSDTASIGRAASRGCVRLTNADVVELFDLVPSGATIVSLRG